jgi:CheY-like chemotaxis protein
MVTGHDGVEAVEIAERDRPQVVLLKIGLPRLDGRGACRLIRERPLGPA